MILESNDPTYVPIFAGAGAGGGIAPVISPALNASSTYGEDVTEDNNFGLGSSYASPAARNAAARQAAAAPSLWWLIVFVLLVWKVL